jgi:hypothetical protein
MLREIKVVDLKRSQVDSKKSDPEIGKYVFVPGGKKYLDRGFASVADNLFFSWCQYNNKDGFRMLNEWKVKYGYEPIKNKVDPYWPEGAALNAEKYWQYGDLILVAAPLDKELERRKKSVEIAGADKPKGEAGKNILRSFARGVNAVEPGAGIDPDEMEHLLGTK